MANKWYIYEVRGKSANTYNSRFLAIGESQNRVPLSYKLLSAYENAVYSELIDDYHTDIVTDYKKEKNI